MLAAQMGAVISATMMMARRLNHVETIPQQDAAERALNKLARTFATQMEALKRYRTGGTQKVTVEHVTVNAGGQAIVGNVAHGGRGRMKIDDNLIDPAQRLRDAPRCSARAKRTGERCNCAGGQGLASLPRAWGAGRSAPGQSAWDVEARRSELRGPGDTCTSQGSLQGRRGRVIEGEGPSPEPAIKGPSFLLARLERLS